MGAHLQSPLQPLVAMLFSLKILSTIGRFGLDFATALPQIRDMKATSKPEWPREVSCGSVTVKVYKRITASGNVGFQLVYRDSTGRKFLSFSDEATALQQAEQKARALSTVGVKAASLTDNQLQDAVTALDIAARYKLTLTSIATRLDEFAAQVGGLANLPLAVQMFNSQNRTVKAVKLTEAIKQFLIHKGVPETVQRGTKLSRHGRDLMLRLDKFSKAFVNGDTGSVSTASVQAWFDSLKDDDGKRLSAQSVKNYKTVLANFFGYCVSRGLAFSNPVKATDKIKVRNGDVTVFTPADFRKLLDNAAKMPNGTLAYLVLGGLAGLRSAEILRLDWSDIKTAEKFVVVSAGNSKTASRRTVPLCESALAWLERYKDSTGKIWPHSERHLHTNLTACAKLAGVEWQDNGLRHSAASYWFAGCNDAGRVAGYMGNSASVIHRHYRALVTPAAALEWFGLAPQKALPDAAK
jgi:integrase